MTLTHVDLFAGIGGFSKAFRSTGAKTVAVVEIDKNCRNVLRRHFPEAAQFDDIKNVSGDDLRAAGFIPERGVITGGSPCQDFSIAGKRVGLDGERSGLFREYLRLLEELQPKWFVFENVPGLLSSNGGRDYGAVQRALVECGYSIAGRILDAQHFGVPQRRRRIFIVGHLGISWRAPAEVLFEPESLCGDSPQGGEEESETSRGAGIGADGSGEQLIKIDTHTHTVSTLQGGGNRGYRIDAEAAAGGQLIVQTL